MALEADYTFLVRVFYFLNPLPALE
jgi:hypothetical protein